MFCFCQYVEGYTKSRYNGPPYYGILLSKTTEKCYIDRDHKTYYISNLALNYHYLINVFHLSTG